MRKRTTAGCIDSSYVVKRWIAHRSRVLMEGAVHQVDPLVWRAEERWEEVP